MSDNPKIKIRNLYKAFGNNKVLNGIDLDIRNGKSLVILGGSGTGKSVLIKIIVGLLTPDSGSIMIDDTDTTHLSRQSRFDLLKKCGFLFQGGALFDSLTVEENITFFVEKLRKLSPSDRKELATSKLEAVGLSSKILNSYPAELSGGMQKRVALARAICSDPEIIFLDEPTTGLDPIMANVINELIIKISNQLKTTTITITHDMHSAKMIAEDVALLYEGKVIWHGTKAEMQESNNEYLHQFIQGLTTGPISY